MGCISCSTRRDHETEWNRGTGQSPSENRPESRSLPSSASAVEVAAGEVSGCSLSPPQGTACSSLALSSMLSVHRSQAMGFPDHRPRNGLTQWARSGPKGKEPTPAAPRQHTASADMAPLAESPTPTGPAESAQRLTVLSAEGQTAPGQAQRQVPWKLLVAPAPLPGGAEIKPDPSSPTSRASNTFASQTAFLRLSLLRNSRQAGEPRSQASGSKARCQAATLPKAPRKQNTPHVPPLL